MLAEVRGGGATKYSGFHVSTNCVLCSGRLSRDPRGKEYLLLSSSVGACGVLACSPGPQADTRPKKRPLPVQGLPHSSPKTHAEIKIQNSGPPVRPSAARPPARRPPLRRKPHQPLLNPRPCLSSCSMFRRRLRRPPLDQVSDKVQESPHSQSRPGPRGRPSASP